MKETQLTLQLPESEVAFLEAFAKRHKVPVAELVTNFIKQLRIAEEEYSHHPDIQKFAGIVPRDVDAKTSYYDYLEKKHK
jgi:hypothetical protein